MKTKISTPTPGTEQTIYPLRQHPFNLKGGAIVFFGVKIFVFASQRSRKYFSQQVVATLFFSTKTKC